jgi:hypothetical protein
MPVSNFVRSLCAGMALAAAPALLAQQWEVGAQGGGSLYLNNSVTGSRGSGDVGFKPGIAAGGWLGHSTGGRLGGEIRYLFQRNDMKVASGGTSYAFGGVAHSVHYDLLIHKGSSEDRVRPFFAVGGGIKGYRGTGKEVALQPLINVAILTQTQQWQPMLSFGGGVKWTLGPRTLLRAEVRDFVTPFPTDVILPTPGNKVSGWVHSITPLIGISYTF